MRVHQISMTRGPTCGIALFADNLESHLQRAGVDVTTTATLEPLCDADVVLLHFHEELLSCAQAVAVASASPGAAVLFAHSDQTSALRPYFDGFIAMCPGMIPPAATSAHVFPHPAISTTRLEDRSMLRREFGLPLDRRIVGTSGFLKFERQFPEVLARLLPAARELGWVVQLMTSPWRLDSPGLVEHLEHLAREASDHFRFEHGFLDAPTLNRRLQACNLLWCWTEAPSSPYASGVASDQYASGTRLIAADKLQHQHVLCLPNTIVGASELSSFLDDLIAEMRSGFDMRHDPSVISWEHCIDGIAEFLRRTALAKSVGH